MELNEKSLAIILWSEKDGVEEASAHTGTLRRAGVSYEFHRGENSPTFMLEHEWIARIKPVTEDLKETLMGADYMLSLTVGPIPDNVDLSELVPTGLRISKEG